MEQSILKLLLSASQAAFPGAEIDAENMKLEIPAEEKFGDFSSNIAMQLGKKVGQNPREVAQAIIAKFPKNELVEKIEIAGPGFLNFYLTTPFLETRLRSFDPHEQIDSVEKMKICIDSSHPNIAKPLHFGHLRSTILGEALARIFRHGGHEVMQDNFLGDWGTQFGKLVVAIRKWGDREQIAQNPIAELTKLYQKFHQEAENDPDLEKQGAEEFRKMEVDGDAENLELWKWIVAESLKEVQKFYDLVDAHFDTIRGESFYEPQLAEILQLLRKSEVGTAGEKGALVVHFPEETKLPTMIFQRADGATLYQTRDLARIRFYEKENYEVLLYVVGNDQNLHFQQVFKTAQLLHLKPQCEHISYGMIRLPEGKMSTRKGNVVDLMAVFTEAEKRVRAILQERGVDFPENEQTELAKMLAIGAIKFNDLSQNRNTTIVFDWERMLSFEGFSAPFLQYSYARARSILRKAEAIEFTAADFAFTENAERKLVAKILQFPGVVERAAVQRMPHFLAQYAYELASIFNSFYAQCPVMQATEKEQRARLFLTEKMCETLRQALYLLTIEVPERM